MSENSKSIKKVKLRKSITTFSVLKRWRIRWRVKRT